ncbi:IS21 ORF1 [Shigella sonnei]|nr:IS21 ORF1 [Shigella sonnei]
MLSREDFYMIKQMRQQGAYIVDIATQIGCSERTVRRYLKYPEPPARKTTGRPHTNAGAAPKPQRVEEERRNVTG